MYILRLGIISSLLSETLVSGFTTGAAMHVLLSQVKDLLGIKLSVKTEFFQFIYVSNEFVWTVHGIVHFLMIFRPYRKSSKKYSMEN